MEYQLVVILLFLEYLYISDIIEKIISKLPHIRLTTMDTFAIPLHHSHS